jgi:hypothetical protein
MKCLLLVPTPQLNEVENSIPYGLVSDSSAVYILAG